MGILFQDLQYAWRMLRKSPAFTSVAILTLAFGIGANTAIFSLVNALMLKMLPVRNPSELVVIGDPQSVHSRSMGNPRVDQFSHPLYRELSSSNSVFTGMLASGEAHRLRITATDTGNPIASSVTGVLVSGNYFSVLGVNALYGRVLTPDDDSGAGAHPVAVVSYHFWKESLGQDMSAVGRAIRINNSPFTIVGVTPPGFFGDTIGDDQALWVPVTMQEQIITGRKWLEDYQSSWLHLIGRLKPGTSVEQARANLNLLLQQQLQGPLGAKLTKDDIENLKNAKIPVVEGGSGFSELRGDFRQPLLLLMIIVGLVLLIACVNVANLLLARATSRQKEIAVRMAIGAAPGRMVRQLLTESVFLAFAGGALGLLIAQWGTKALLKLSGTDELQASADVKVFLFTAGVCLLTGILFGLIPALRARNVPVALTLKSGPRSGGDAPGKLNWGKVLVTGQVALSLFVLFAASLLVRSLQNIRNVDLGYNREHILMVSTDPLSAGYDKDRIVQYGEEISEKLKSVPGVRAATFSKNGLFSGSESSTTLKIEGFTARDNSDPEAAWDQVGTNYFSAVGIPLLIGRDIGPQDTAAALHVAVINETMLKKYFGNTNPIGKKLQFDKDTIEIVGVARDARDHELKGEVVPRFYVPSSQLAAPNPVLNFEIKTVGNPSAVAESVRKLLKDYDSNVPVNSVRTLNDLTERTISQEILISKLSSFFAGLALLLAAIGLYGILSYSVAGRTREIGVRMALGARRSSVLQMILQEAGKLVVMGVLIGIPASFLSSRLFSSMLFGLSKYDPVAMAVVIVILVAIALLASFIPARRATKVDPMVALRYE